jgi:iron complex outermembrane receptor protein
MRRIIPHPRKTLFVRAAVTGGLAIWSGNQVAAQTAGPSNQPVSVGSAIQEIIVTASRRNADVNDIPYNISAVGGDALDRIGTSDLAQFANQVPGFDLEDRGARYGGASVPIIRGLNSSSTERRGLVSEDMPVGTYIGNSPAASYFPLDDVQRIEVLRGPQGTLYGAGALGGAIRVIPNDPQLDQWSARLDASGSNTAHSSDTGYSASGLLNAPLGPIAALRMSVKYDYEPGFINQDGILERAGGSISSPPVLANPGNIANSSGIYYSKPDSNFTDTTSGRLSLLVQPSDRLKFDVGYNYARVSGNGGPVDNPGYAGGASPIDPHISFPATGEYSIVNPTLEPFRRESHLTSLDASYDAGFATLSSTTTYADTNGFADSNEAFTLFILPSSYLGYYVGNPIDPRLVAINRYADSDHTLSEEFRIVSKTGEIFDYVVGAFYAREGRGLDWNIYEPGITQQAMASGGTPVTTDSSGRVFFETGQQEFTDKSVFAEATWHITKRWEATLGGRFSHQDFSESLNFYSYTFGFGDQGASSTAYNEHLGKLNLSYKFADNQLLYATASQGFRRGGANAFPLTGFLRESASILDYKPDTANNYEFGIKGHLTNGLRYSADLFYIDWKNPQIGTNTPANSWPVVVNGQTAVSKGFEFELHAPLFRPDLNVSLGYSYADATLSKSFCLPAGDGTGVGFIPCGIAGSAGNRLPGSPKSSGSVTVTYDQSMGESRRLMYTLNSTFKSSIINSLPNEGFNAIDLPSYFFVNASIIFDTGRWRLGTYGTNLLNRRAEFGAPNYTVPGLGSLFYPFTISRPREVGLRGSYLW